MTKYHPEKDLPDFARENKTLSPSKLAEIVLNRRNKEITPESVTMWFKRHPEEYDQLSKELVQGLPTVKQAVDLSIYENGNFKELPSIKNWVKELTNRNAKPETVNSFVSYIKRVCKGEVQQGVLIENWSFKHPDRLSMQDAKDFLFEVKKHGLKSRGYRLALRNFLTSKDMVVKSHEISGELEEDAGQYADMFVSKEKLYQILEWVKARNLKAYLACKFAYKTASRLTATLEADAQYYNSEEHTLTVFEKAVMRKAKKRVVKMIPCDLWDELPKEGRLFDIAEDELNGLLRQAYKEIIPEMADRIPFPFHFWRHMFAQHMLRLTNWNYGLVARLGNWSVEALERYYGKIPHETVVEVGLKTLPLL